ncbi:ABC transporter ATP-binding protein [Gorillibacterium sp. sgz5001074]|uniref:ABC transporter ATP-binding protein n=1 Tax=Gorillibacterium sp. sgz5001074 TaxID=3446695 RepID=UPI003F66A393
MSMVAIRNVVKRYGGTLSVDHLNLNIEPGEIFGLLGPNGAGKSTTIKMLSGLIPADQGELLVDGYSVGRDPMEVKRRIGLVPQELAIFEDLSARDNIVFFARLQGLSGRLLAERVEEALEFTGLKERQKDRPSRFSGGMKRRLNIACAITHRPKLIIMDEPTVGIDPQSRKHILDSVKELNRMGSTIIYTTHYMEEVAAIGTRIGIMDQGRLIACGTEPELRALEGSGEKLVIRTSEVKEAALEELRRHPRIDKVKAVDGSIELEMKASQPYLQDILFILSKHEMAVRSLDRVEANLEMLFLSLTGRKLRD